MPSKAVRHLLALLVVLVAFLSPLSAQRGVPLGQAGPSGEAGGEPLMVMVQISDSQAVTAADQARFDFVLSTVVAAGSPGAVLPRRPHVVLFPGDYVDDDSVLQEWIAVRDAIENSLTATGLPLFGTPGNHDQEAMGIARYEEYIADSGVWDFGSAWFTGQNGASSATGWRGLRFVGFNGSNGAWNMVSAPDIADVEARVAAASASQENVILVGHHRHNERDRTPLESALENSDVIGYVRGHLDQPHVVAGLSGIANPNVFDLNSNSILDVGGILYYEIFVDRIEAYVLRVAFGETELPEPEVIWLQHPMTPVVPIAPVAGFDVSVTTGQAPLEVQFTDTSAGPATDWTWDFGDGNQSTLRNPGHTYLLPGVYSVTLTASNVSGTDTVVQLDLIDVSASARERLFVPVADAMVKSSSPTRNYGSDASLRVRQGGVDYLSYLRFAVDGIGTREITGAFLRLQVTDSSVDGGSVFPVGNDWNESEVAYATAPAALGAVLDQAGPVSSGTWIELDVSAAISGDGDYSFGLSNGSSNSALFSSREGAFAPELLIQLGDPVLPAADFAANVVVGTAPLSVQFMDQSGNGPVVWNWAFGDGAQSTAEDPTHTYTEPGLYSVTLTAINEAGVDTLTRTDWISVEPPIVPTAAFSITDAWGDAPLQVAITDESLGNPTGWSWDFGDGGTSSVQNPVHIYAEAGTFDVMLTASTAAGADTTTQFSAVTVLPPIPTMTFLPVADARVKSTSPDRNYGSGEVLQVRGGNTEYRSYLQFDVSGLSGTPVASSVLRFFVTDGSAVGGTLYDVDSSWAENGITFSNGPLATGAPVASIGAVTGGNWVEVDVTALVNTNGVYSFLVQDGSSNSAIYSSREGIYPPELVVTLDATTTVTSIATADGHVKSSNPTTSYGALDTLRLRGGQPSYTTYLRFDVVGTAGQFVQSATLRLYGIDGSRFGGAVYRVETPWNEASLVFGTAPALVGSIVGSAETAATGAWVEFDLAGVVSGDGTVLLALISTSTDSAIYSSREGMHPPELLITLR